MEMNSMDTSDIANLDIELTDVSQLGIVVEDLDDAMERYASILGISPWNEYVYEPPTLTNTTYRGEDAEFGMRLAMGYAGEMMFELIEPTIGPNIYQDHLDEHGEGLHHLGCFAFEDPNGTIEAFEQAEMPVIQSGHCHGANFWYLDTQEQLNGVMIELSNRIVTDTPLPVPDSVYPEGAEPISFS